MKTRMRRGAARLRPSWTAVAAVTALGAVVLAGCGSAAPPAPPWHLLAVTLPPSLGGYTVQPDTASAAALDTGGGRSLIDGAAVFALRKGDEVFGVLEVAELKPAARSNDPSFDPDVAGQLGQSIPRPVKVRGRTVYEGTASNREAVFTWFRGDRMMVLLVHGLAHPEQLLDTVLGTSL